MRKKKIFILGSYGCGNRGDEAILANIINGMGIDNYDFCVANGAFDDMKKYFPVKTIQCRLSEGKITTTLFFTMIKDSFYQLIEIAKCDALIYGGEFIA